MIRGRKLAPLAVAGPPGPAGPDITNIFQNGHIDALMNGWAREDANAQPNPEASGRSAPLATFCTRWARAARQLLEDRPAERLLLVGLCSPATVSHYLSKQCTVGEAALLMSTMLNSKTKKYENRKAAGASRHMVAEQRRRNKINEW
eukprot:885751-Prorocentrum_minimum.AAC.4